MAKNTAVAAKSTTTDIAAFDVTKFKMGARIVVPSISLKKLKEGDTIYFRAESECEERPATDETTGEPKIENGKPVTLHVLTVTMLQTGEYGQIVVGAIPARGFIENAPVKGRLFAMQKGESTSGKATKWNVVEMIEG